jgi:hypothetical protein
MKLESILNKSKIASVLILMGCLSSCAVYSSNFNCGDSKGARCLMLSEVDKRVDSGEIETVYLDKKCKGKTCNKGSNNVPKKALNQIHKVKIVGKEDAVNEYEDGDDIYLK